jgi:hypothetical protein
MISAGFSGFAAAWVPGYTSASPSPLGWGLEGPGGIRRLAILPGLRGDEKSDANAGSKQFR